MKKLTPEELAQLNLMRETISEMHGEVSDMYQSEVYEVTTWLGYTWTKIAVVLARYGFDMRTHPPTPPGEDTPF